MKTICYVCKTLIKEDDSQAGVSHGYCERCAAAEIRKLEAMKEAEKEAGNA